MRFCPEIRLKAPAVSVPFAVGPPSNSHKLLKRPARVRLWHSHTWVMLTIDSLAAVPEQSNIRRGHGLAVNNSKTADRPGRPPITNRRLDPLFQRWSRSYYCFNWMGKQELDPQGTRVIAKVQFDRLFNACVVFPGQLRSKAHVGQCQSTLTYFNIRINEIWRWALETSVLISLNPR